MPVYRLLPLTTKLARVMFIRPIATLYANNSSQNILSSRKQLYIHNQFYAKHLQSLKTVLQLASL